MQTVKFTLVANCENVMEAHKMVSRVLSFSKRTKMSIGNIEQNFRVGGGAGVQTIAGNGASGNNGTKEAGAGGSGVWMDGSLESDNSVDFAVTPVGA